MIYWVREKIETRAMRGAEFLDRVMPGWYREVNLTKLRMQHCHDCVLGQLVGDYAVRRRRLGDDWIAAAYRTIEGNGQWEHELGFSITDLPTDNHDWDALTSAWQREVRARQGAEEMMTNGWRADA